MYTDQSMLKLLEILKAQGQIRFEKEFCEAAGLLHQNLSRIRNGDAHFTPDHIRGVCMTFMVNANWIFGTDNQVFRNQSKVNQNVNQVNFTGHPAER